MSKKKTATSYLIPKSQQALKGSGVKICFHKNKEATQTKYAKNQFVAIYKGYDMCEDLFTVRTYIQKKYGISQNMLELFLKLMGVRVFSRYQYTTIPKKFGYTRMSRLIKEGYIKIISEHSYDVEQNLYCLTNKTKGIVVHFYQHLSGEKPIPETAQFNKMANNTSNNQWDAKKMALIKKMNQTPVKDHIKRLYED